MRSCRFFRLLIDPYEPVRSTSVGGFNPLQLNFRWPVLEARDSWIATVNSRIALAAAPERDLQFMGLENDTAHRSIHNLCNFRNRVTLRQLLKVLNIFVSPTPAHRNLLH